MSPLRGLALALALAPRFALAGPTALSHTGFILGSGDAPLTGAGQTLAFSLWDDASATGASHRVWPASAPVSCPVDVVAGYYTVSLGGTCGTGLDDAIFATGPLFLEVSVNAVTLSPRVSVDAVGRASVATTSLDTAALVTNLATPGVVNTPSNPVEWSKLRNVPPPLVADEASLHLAGQTLSVKAGGVSNAMLANSAVTISAGAGLTGGGTVALGGSTTLSVPNGGLTNGMLANSNVTISAGSGLTGGGTVALGGMVSLGLGLVGTGSGGTGLTSAPTAAGQFLRSSGAGTWAIGGLAVGDVPDLSSSYVTTGTTQTLSGTKTFNSVITADDLVTKSGLDVSSGMSLSTQRRILLYQMTCLNLAPSATHVAAVTPGAGANAAGRSAAAVCSAYVGNNGQTGWSCAAAPYVYSGFSGTPSGYYGQDIRPTWSACSTVHGNTDGYTWLDPVTGSGVMMACCYK